MASEAFIIRKIDSEEVNIFKMNYSEVNIQNEGEPSQVKLRRDEIAHDIQARNPSLYLINLWAS